MSCIIRTPELEACRKEPLASVRTRVPTGPQGLCVEQEVIARGPLAAFWAAGVMADGPD